MKVRLQRYVLKEMEPAELFYFAGDSKKTVYTLNDVRPFERLKQAGYTKDYANCRLKNPPDGKLHVERHLANRYVIYLRNINSI